MEAVLFLNAKNVIPIPVSGMLYYMAAEEHWLAPKPQYDNHVMAMMLIDILHDNKMVNDSTYRKIKMKYKK